MFPFIYENPPIYIERFHIICHIFEDLLLYSARISLQSMF